MPRIRLAAIARVAPLAIAALTLALSATGCIDVFQPRVGTARAIATPAPIADSPAHLLQRFQWCWVNRRIAEYEELFTNDFRFQFGAADSIDNAPILRQDEIDIARNIFVDGTATEPRANRIELTFNSNLLAVPDTRPGKTAPWHQQITTSVVLRVETSETIFQVSGDATFYCVSGDSADLPDDLLNRFDHDPGHWYIEGWVDQTGSGSGGTSARGITPGDVLRAGVDERRRARRSVVQAAAAARPLIDDPMPLSVTWAQLMAIYR